MIAHDNTPEPMVNIELSPVMSWKEANSIANDLIHNRYDYGMGLMIKIGIYSPLLISEILRLTWADLMTSDLKSVKGIENKKGQFIPFNKQIRKDIVDVYHLYCEFNGNKLELSEYVVVRKGEHQNSTQVGRFFAKLHKMYPMLQRPIKMATLRATFGRRILSQYGETPEVISLLKTLLGQASSIGVRKALFLDVLSDDLSLESICSNLDKERETFLEVDGTIHRFKF